MNKPLVEVLINALLNSSERSSLEAGFDSMRNNFLKFIDENPNFSDQLEKFILEIQRLPDVQQQTWSDAAKMGWYVNAETSLSNANKLPKNQCDLDDYMMNELENDWALLTQSILDNYPKRKEILECAFQLHSEGRYIASIPLFLAQADGICAETISTGLFTKAEEQKNKIIEFIEMTKINEYDFTGIFLEALTIKTQFFKGSSSYSAKKKATAPNRNGILHGSSKHLDYGTKVNSFKAFSLLAFVVFVL